MEVKKRETAKKRFKVTERFLVRSFIPPLPLSNIVPLNELSYAHLAGNSTLFRVGCA